MALYLGILIFSFIVTSLAIIPFIDLLYRLHLTSPVVKNPAAKLGTPVGGGVLIIAVVSFLFAVIYPLISRFGVFIQSTFNIADELNIIFFTFISFGLLGLYEDIVKIFHLPVSRTYQRLKNPLQFVLSATVGLLLYQNLHLSVINLPFVGVWQLGWWYIPVSTLVIYIFARGFDITDGLDGLAGGILLVCLIAFWTMSVSLLDTPLATFIALWIGSLIAFLYFNVFPARIWLGNGGGLSFGSTLAVCGLLLGKTVALLVIGSIFIIEALANLLQLIWTSLFHRRLFPISPPHYWLQSIGWPEPKIVMRAWIAAIFLALLGLSLAG